MKFGRHDLVVRFGPILVIGVVSLGVLGSFVVGFVFLECFGSFTILVVRRSEWDLSFEVSRGRIRIASVQRFD